MNLLFISFKLSKSHHSGHVFHQTVITRSLIQVAKENEIIAHPNKELLERKGGGKTSNIATIG